MGAGGKKSDGRRSSTNGDGRDHRGGKNYGEPPLAALAALGFDMNG